MAIRPDDNMLTVTLQIDIENPFDKRKQQNVPKHDVEYQDILSFRVIYDS